jgi:glutamyl-tRNA(Gln) amidotransferase subunit E
LFEELAGKGFEPTAAAVLLLEGLVQLKREGIEVENISSEMVEELLKAVQGGALTKEVQLEALASWAKQPSKSLEEVIAGLGLKKAGKGEAEEIIRKLVEKNRKMLEEKGEFAVKALMGEAMRELKGKASGKEVNELLEKEIKKVQGK